MEAAFLRLPALGGDIDLARRIFADNHDREAGLNAVRRNQFGRQVLDLGDDLFRDFFSVDDFSHEPLPCDCHVQRAHLSRKMRHVIPSKRRPVP